jgi:hypothetical protein
MQTDVNTKDSFAGINRTVRTFILLMSQEGKMEQIKLTTTIKKEEVALGDLMVEYLSLDSRFAASNLAEGDGF